MDYKIVFIQNNTETNRQIKYANMPFSIKIIIENHINPHKIMLYCGNDEKVLISKEAKNGEFSIPELQPGLYFFHFELDTQYGRLYTTPEKNVFSKEFSGEDRFLSVKNNYDSNFGLKGGSIYHIFVDRFYKSGEVAVRNDAVLLNDWENGIPEYTEKIGDFLKNNTFFGGTLTGITQKLDYIKNLGTEIIYLSPIFKAYSNHKYDVGDFLAVDEMFGNESALAELIDKTHEKGMKIILDGVFNHVGDDSVYFDKYHKNPPDGAFYNKNSPYRDWFSFNDKGYDCWWGITNLPKINKIPSYRTFICETVIPKYMMMGIDGWRLDVVDEYDNDFLEQIVEASKKYNPHAIIIGEVWDDATVKIAYEERKSYFHGKSVDSVMNYPLRDGIIDFIKTKNADKIKKIIKSQSKYYPFEKQLFLMNFLGTHDTERIFTVLGGESGENLGGSVLAHKCMNKYQRETAKKMFINAYTLLAALPGIPSIYYGDETGLEGYRDPFNRRTFPWHNMDVELIKKISDINKCRSNNEALIFGEIEILETPPQILAFIRYTDKKSTAVLFNMSGEKYDMNIKSLEIQIKPLEIIIKDL